MKHQKKEHEIKLLEAEKMKNATYVVCDDIRTIKEMVNEGIISETEFSDIKKRLIKSINVIK